MSTVSRSQDRGRRQFKDKKGSEGRAGHEQQRNRVHRGDGTHEIPSQLLRRGKNRCEALAQGEPLGAGTSNLCRGRERSTCSGMELARDWALLLCVFEFPLLFIAGVRWDGPVIFRNPRLIAFAFFALPSRLYGDLLLQVTHLHSTLNGINCRES